MAGRRRRQWAGDRSVGPSPDRIPTIRPPATPPVPDTDRQDRHWSRAAARYDDLFLDPFRPGVENPLLDEVLAVPDPGSKVVADLGCGTGPLLPHLVGRFGRVVALDFAPGMIAKARKRLEAAGGGRRGSTSWPGRCTNWTTSGGPSTSPSRSTRS